MGILAREIWFISERRRAGLEFSHGQGTLKSGVGVLTACCTLSWFRVSKGREHLIT